MAIALTFAATACVGGRQSAGGPIPPSPPPQSSTRGSGAPAILRVEAESGRLHGLQIETRRQGYSGTGYVTGFDQDGDRLEVDVRAPAGIYDLLIGYASPDSVKGYALRVGDERTTGMLQQRPSFGPHDAGLFVLGGGSSRIEIGKGWGYYDIDYVELRPATPDPVRKPPKTLADGDATPEARSLYAYLVDQFGEKTLVGQQDLSEVEYVRGAIGKEPAIGAFDLMEYSPSRRAHGADPKGLIEKIIAWADRRAIVSLCWHWNAPRDLVDQPGKEWWRGFNSNATSFDVAAALRAPDSDAYRALIGDIDAIAVELRKLETARIPVLWRPLHEAEGGWFWWGAKGPEAFVALYRLLFDRLVHHHGLHNLIWVYSPPDRGTEAAQWYPGDDCVDVVGADVYTDASSSMSGSWRSLLRTYSGRKLVALGETGTLPDPALERRLGIRWSYTTLWSGQFLRGMPLERLRTVYSDPDVVTRDELPDLRHYQTPGS